MFRTTNSFFLFFLAILLLAACHSSFRIKRVTLDAQSDAYLLPPGTTLRVKNGSFAQSRKVKSVFIEKVQLLQEPATKVHVSKTQAIASRLVDIHIPSPEKGFSHMQIDFYYEKLFTTHGFDEVGFKQSIDEIRILLEDMIVVGFQKVNAQPGRYPSLHVTLPPAFRSTVNFKLSNVVAQDIIDQIFDDLPLPKSLSSYRYMYVQHKDYTFLLLNPRLDLEASVPSFQRTPTDPKLNAFYPSNRITYDIIRTANGTLKFDMFNSGLAVSSSYANIIKEVNAGAGPKTVSLVDAPLDLDFSQQIRNHNYLGLFQRSYVVGLSDATKTSPKVDESQQQFGTHLLFTSNLEEIFPLTAQSYAKNHSAVFGTRSLVWPLIRVLENNTLTHRPFPLESDYYTNELGYNKSFSLKRLHHGKYHRVKLKGEAIVLLPADKINFK